VFFDLQGVAGRDTRGLLQDLGKHIAGALASRGINVTLPSWSLDASPFADLEEFLDRVEIAMPPKGVLALLLDEFEQLQDSAERGKLTPDIFPNLRSLMQHRARIAFVLAGTHQLEEMNKDYWGPLFHIGLDKRIGPLSRTETEKLILEPVFPTIQYDERAVEQIYSVTQGHPYFVQVICHDLISRVNTEKGEQGLITVSHVKNTIGKILGEQDSQLHSLWSETTREEKLVLAALSMNPEAGTERVSRTEISERLRTASLPEDVINQALERLLMQDLVKLQVGEEQGSFSISGQELEISTPGKGYLYLIAFDLFRRWIAKKHPLGTLHP
jgi:hypothetical protein